MGIPDDLTCLLRNLYVGQEATVRTKQGTTDCFQIGKGVHQGCMLSPCLFNLYAEYIMMYVQFSSVSRSVVSDTLRPHESQHTRPPCPSATPGVHSDSSPLSPWCHPAISSSVVPSPPAPNPSQHPSLFQWVNSLHEVAKVLEFQLQHHSFQRNPRADLLQNGLVGSPCSPRDSEEFSIPQF